jgi:CBS domain-containing protein
MTLTVFDIMTKRLEFVAEMASVQEAARKMKEKNVSSLIVIDEKDKPKGLVTEQDLVRKVCINDNDVNTSSVTIREITSSPLIVINSNLSPSIAIDAMLQNNVRHLLVVDKNDANKPVGIITPLDFTKYEEYTNEGEKDSIEKILEYYI